MILFYCQFLPRRGPLIELHSKITVTKLWRKSLVVTQNMALDIRDYLAKLLQKNILLKQGAVKLLNTPSITHSARYQAQQEFQEAQEQIVQLEKQLELLERLPQFSRKAGIPSAKKPAKNSETSTTYLTPKAVTPDVLNITGSATSAQIRLDTMIEALRFENDPRRQVELTNQICSLLISSETKNVRYPSMSVIIPIIWPMLMSKHKPVSACGYKLLRYFMTSHDDVVIVFYLYHKYHHHDRYYYFPYYDYSKIHNQQYINDTETDLYDFFNYSDLYKPESHYDTSERNDFNIKARETRTVSSKLTLPLVSDNTVKKWWPLIFLIVSTLVDDKGTDVSECIKFIRKVIELKGIRFLGSLSIRVSVALAESVIASISLKLNNFQNFTPSTLESIKLSINLVECLCEVVVADSKLAFETKVIKFLIQILIDPPFTVTHHQLTNMANSSASSASEITMTINMINNAVKNISTIPLPVIINLLRIPNTRKYLVDCGFIPLLLSALLDPPILAIANTTISPSHGHMNSPKMQHLASILSVVMCTWSGLGLLLENDARYLRVLIDGLYSEQVYVRTVVMSVIAGGLRIRKLTALTGNHDSYELWDWERAFIAANGSSKTKETVHPNDLNSLNVMKNFSLADIRTKLGGRCCPEYEDNIVNQFTAVFLQSCLQCGLIDVLKTLFNSFENDKRATRWIALLLSEILYLRSKIIPSQIEFDYTISLKMNRLIERESRKHAKLNQKVKDEININTNQLIKKSEIAANGSELAIVSIFLKTTTISSLHPFINLPASSAPLLDQVTLDNILQDLKNIPDDVDIRPIIVQTHLPATKEYREWNWALISVLVRGILWNDAKFEETLKTTKFFKRLISFYKPQKAGFVQVVYYSTGPIPGFTDRRQPLDVDFFLNRGKDSKDRDRDRRISRKQREKMAEMYVDVGIALIQLLLSKPEGAEILRASGIIQTVSTSLLRVSGVFINGPGNEPGKNWEADNVPDSGGSGNRNFAGFSLDHHDSMSLFNPNEATTATGAASNDMHVSKSGSGIGESSASASTASTTNAIGGSSGGTGISGSFGFFDSPGDNDTIIDDSNILKMKKEGLFGPTRLFSTLAWGYIRFIGVLSSHPVGIVIMEEYGVVDALFRLVQTGRDNFTSMKHSNDQNQNIDMIRFIIQEIDFRISGQLRFLIEKVAAVGDEDVRVEVVERIIGDLCSLKKVNDNNDYTIERWCVGLLVRQSYDFSLKVSQLAVKGLIKYVEDERSVDILLSFNPDLGDINVNMNVRIGNKMYGGVLLWKVLGYERGVDYVNSRSSGLIEQIVEGWADSRREWVNKLETTTYKKMRGIVIEEEERYDYFELFQRLVKTEKGVQCIVNSGIIQHFVRVILIYCKFLKMGIEKELYGLGKRRRYAGKTERVKNGRKSFAGSKPGFIQSVEDRKKLIGKRPVWYDSSDTDYEDQSRRNSAEESHNSTHGGELRDADQEGEEPEETDREDDPEDSYKEDKEQQDEKAYIRRWEDKWLNDEADSQGLIEETKCSIWALGYLGQTDSGIFAIESVLENVIEEKNKARSRRRGEVRGRGRAKEPHTGDSSRHKYDDYSDCDEEEEEGESEGGSPERAKGAGGGDGDVGSSGEREYDAEESGSEDEEVLFDEDEHYENRKGWFADRSERYRDNKDIIENFIEIYKNSINWELRGSCITAIGKISECEMGCEILEESNIESIQRDERECDGRGIRVSLSKEGLIGYEQKKRVSEMIRRWKRENGAGGEGRRTEGDAGARGGGDAGVDDAGGDSNGGSHAVDYPGPNDNGHDASVDGAQAPGGGEPLREGPAAAEMGVDQIIRAVLHMTDLQDADEDDDDGGDDGDGDGDGADPAGDGANTVPGHDGDAPDTGPTHDPGHGLRQRLLSRSSADDGPGPGADVGPRNEAPARLLGDLRHAGDDAGGVGGGAARAAAPAETLGTEELRRRLRELCGGVSTIVVNQGRGVATVQRALKRLRARARAGAGSVVGRVAVQVLFAVVAAGLVVLKSGVLRFLVAELELGSSGSAGAGTVGNRGCGRSGRRRRGRGEGGGRL